MFLTIKLYVCQTEEFEIELFICIKMGLALNNLHRLICHKNQLNKQTKNIETKSFFLNFKIQNLNEDINPAEQLVK